MDVRHGKKARWGIESLLWFGALACLGCCGFFSLRASSAQQQAQVLFPDRAKVALAAASIAEAPAIEGRVEIPRLHVSVPILSDCSDGALRLGSCHVPGTAVAGGLGNMGVAGHRDGSFRPLRNIQIGDRIDVFAAEGEFHYLVQSMGVVAADDVSVLAIGDEPELTLITCFPFNYIGTAPKRFVVHAKLLSVDGT